MNAKDRVEYLNHALEDYYNERDNAVMQDDWDKIENLNLIIKNTLAEIESLKGK